MNHCDVARKITGLWQRQQCGYWCANASRCHSRPRSLSASSTFGFASNTRMPAEQLDGVEEVPAGSDRRVDLEAVLHAGVEVVGAVAGRGVHRAGAGFERDVVAEHAERVARRRADAGSAMPLERRALHPRERRVERRARRPGRPLGASASATITARPSTSYAA